MQAGLSVGAAPRAGRTIAPHPPAAVAVAIFYLTLVQEDAERNLNARRRGLPAGGLGRGTLNIAERAGERHVDGVSCCHGGYVISRPSSIAALHIATVTHVRHEGRL
jgi:hypothetical protein